MLGFEKPEIKVTEYTESTNFGKFVIEPLEKGFGITLGNSLRRVLLSSLPGVAITDIQIDGVVHEFSTIEGVLEDVTTIILNLKKVILKAEDTESHVLEITSENEGVVTAGDIVCDANIEVINKDLHIATLAKGARFHMKMSVHRGRGYVRAEFNKHDGQALGVIPIDSIYTPVENVSYTVDTRISKDTTFDRLNLEIRTDGSVSPVAALAMAAKIMSQHLEDLVVLDERAIMTDFMIEKENVAAIKSSDMNIEELDLSVRSYNSLKRAGINTLNDLLAYSEDEMSKIRNLGKKSLKEILEKLVDMDLTLRSE